MRLRTLPLFFVICPLFCDWVALVFVGQVPFFHLQLPDDFTTKSNAIMQHQGYGSFSLPNLSGPEHVSRKKTGIFFASFLLCALFLTTVIHTQVTPVELAVKSSGFTIYESQKDNKHWFSKKAPGKHHGKAQTITVDPRKKLQTILGFGGAFTDAAAFNIGTLDKDRQSEIFNAYFGSPSSSLGYTLCRSHINSVDFSLSSYSCDDVRGDLNLSQFRCDHDDQVLIPFIQQALKIHNAQAKPDHFRLFMSPWSPPAWMKSNGQMVGSYEQGLIADPKIHAAWAEYLSKFASYYKSKGIPVWGMTVQNEPANAAPWEACCYTKESMRDFVRDHLGPQLKQDHPQLQLMIWDHNRDMITDWAKCILEDKQASQYVAGTGFHWYAENSPSLTDYDHLDQTQALDPSKFVLSTEATYCPGTSINDWARGEAYGWDILNTLKHGSVGWVDWNLVLSMEGGPNHANNLCDAPILVDTPNQQVHYQPMYAFIGHFSKYVRPGAVQIDLQQESQLHCRHQPHAENYMAVCRAVDWACSSGLQCDPYECTDQSWKQVADVVFDQWYQQHLSQGPYACNFDGSASLEGVQTVAFQNLDSTIVVVALNVGEQAQDYELHVHSRGRVRSQIPARSIQTIVID